jgi:predicted CXXCH cytochrome family protein
MRTRTAKTLARRIDLDYFKRSHPLRRWRAILSLAASLLGLIWIAVLAAPGSRTPYSSGPLAAPHAFIETRCEVCHVPSMSLRAHARDAACLACHDAPAHPPTPPSSMGAAAESSLTPAIADSRGPTGTPSRPEDDATPPRTAAPAVVPPACVACHREHRGQVALSLSPDAFCVDCHSGDTRAAAARASVSGFPDGHPPFAASAGGVRDTGTIRFNHEVHLRSDLPGPDGPERLECSRCHQPSLARVSDPAAREGLMRPVTYEQQCARCHPLYFDEFVGDPAPHEDPAIVREFVVTALQAHIAAHPDDLVRRAPTRRLPLNFPSSPETAARTPEEWVARRAARAEQLLWSHVCAECHDVRDTPGQNVPAIAPAALPHQWMPRAAFSHTPHLMLQCETCHAARTSRETADVLMPSVATCATCHREESGTMARCAECHVYHDWTKRRPVAPAFTLDAFR